MSDDTAPTPWLERSIDLAVAGLPEAQSEAFQPPDSNQEALPPGRMPYISRNMARAIVGDPLAPTRNSEAVGLKQALSDCLAKRAKVRLQMANIERRMAQLMVRAHALEGLAASKGCWSEYLKLTTAHMKLMELDGTLTDEAIAAKRAMGEDIGELETPEQAILRSKDAAVSPKDEGKKSPPKTLTFKRSVETDG